MEYFVEERGVDEVLFEGKLTHPTTFHRTAAPAPEAIAAPMDTEVDVPSNDEIIEIVLPAVHQPQVDPTFKPVLRHGSCEGYTVQLSSAQSPHSTYPFALHDRFSLPWNYAIWNGVLILFSRACRGLQGGVTRTFCIPRYQWPY